MIERQEMPVLSFQSRSGLPSVFFTRTGELFSQEDEAAAWFKDSFEVSSEVTIPKKILSLVDDSAPIVASPRGKVLVALVTSKCNHSCEYCLASKGIFGQKNQDELSREEYLSRIEDWVKNNKDVKIVKLFGGEPFLEPDLSEAVAERLVAHASTAPFIGLTTNGTVGKAKDHIDFLRKYRINLTVSIDGPKEIHDASRMLADGSSFDHAVKFCADLRDLNFPFAVAAVFDDRHMNAKISYLDLVRFLGKISPVRKVQFLYQIGDAENRFAESTDALREQIWRDVDEMFDVICKSTTAEEWLEVYENTFALILSNILRGDAEIQETVCSAANMTSFFRNGNVSSCYLMDSDFDRSRLTWKGICGGKSAIPWFATLVPDACAKDLLLEQKTRRPSFSRVAKEALCLGILRNVADVTPGSREHAALIGFMRVHEHLAGLRKME